MEGAKDVEDLGGLTGAPSEAAEVNPVLASDAGEGPSAPAPQQARAGEDPVSAPAPAVEDTPAAPAQAAEDPAAPAAPSQVAGSC